MSINDKEEPQSNQNINNEYSKAMPGCFLVIENMFKWHTPTTIWFGSIVLAENGIFFIKYSEPLTDALTSPISISKRAIEKSKAIATRKKRREWGFPISDVFKRNAESIFIPRQDITKISIVQETHTVKTSTKPINTRLIVHIFDGDPIYFDRMNEVLFGTPLIGYEEHDLDIYEKELIDYGSGLNILNEEHMKRYGLNIPFPPPAIFIESISSSTFHSQFADEMLLQIAGNQEYMDRIFEFVVENRRLLDFFSELPEPFRIEIRKRAITAKPFFGLIDILTPLFLIIGFLIIAGIYVILSPENLNSWPRLPTFVGLSAILLGLLSLFFNLSQQYSIVDLCD